MFKITILLLCFSSCDRKRNFEKERKVFEHSKRMVLTDTLNIKLPDSISHIKSETRPFFSSDGWGFGYLTRGVDNNMYINRYLFQENKWEIIKINTQGPNQVYGQGAFSFSEKNDMFYYFPLNTPRILEVKKNGEVQREHKYSPDRTVAYNSQVKSPNIIDDGQSIFFDIGEYRSLEDVSTYEEVSLIGIYDYQINKFRKIVKYPEEFHGKKWSPNDVAKNFVIADEKIFMSFSKSKYIYVYDLEGEFIEKSTVGIDAIKDSEGLKSDDSFANALAQVNNGYYHNLIYDKWRKVFYRIGIHYDVKQRVESPQDMGRAFQKRVMTIITFDSDLNIIAEAQFFTLQTFLMENYFLLNTDGFYLNATLPDQPENLYKFIRLELRDIE